MKNNNLLEKVIEDKVCAYAKTLGCLVYKFTSPSRCSVPDRMFINPGGFTWWIEFKRKGKEPTPAQEVEIGRMRKQGCTVYVVDDVDFGKKAVDLVTL